MRTLDERLENVAVLGAAGKMGSGIVLLLAQEMAKLKVANPQKSYHLYAVDINEDALDGLVEFIRVQSVKTAEKTCVALRDLYREREDLVENFEIIDQYSLDVMSVLRPATCLSSIKDGLMIFEAIIEDIDIKEKVLSEAKNLCSAETFFFTNTSSIPIQEIDRRVGLDGRIIGFHFYNPPAVQKLAELIPADTTKDELVNISHELGSRLRKIIIPSNDIAGFIGNGHFMRDILHAQSEVERLSKELSTSQAIWAVNRIGQDFLIRPMGIFQLIDYVGIDVCQLIMKVMTKYIKEETLSSELINRMVDKKILGGQNPDGSQKDGFLQYKKNRPVGVFDLDSGKYLTLEENGVDKEIDNYLGALPEGHSPWRALLMDPDRENKLQQYFTHLKNLDTRGGELARAYFIESKRIAEQLVADGVAASPDDVNGVLLNGFYHLYGPVNNFFD